MNKLPIDNSLTPENAEGQGLGWYQDIIIDPEEPDRDDSHLLRLLAIGWEIGMPASHTPVPHSYALYKPLRKENA